MSLIFYFAPMSTASVTAAVFDALDVPHERRTLDLSAGDTRTPEFLAINPNGRVPTIVHDGVPIWESAAITLYLGETFGVAKGLFPPAGTARGRAMSWLVWGSTTFAAAAGRWAATLPPDADGAVEAASVDFVGQPDLTVRAKARAEIEGCLRILDAALSPGPFLVGDYSLVDVHLAVFIDWLSMMAVPLAGYPGVAAWFGRVQGRDAGARPAS